jgi:hypothetical protein
MGLFTYNLYYVKWRYGAICVGIVTEEYTHLHHTG